MTALAVIMSMLLAMASTSTLTQAGPLNDTVLIAQLGTLTRLTGSGSAPSSVALPAES